jgi:hypothetical protein
MSASAPQGLANLPAAMAPGQADPGGGYLYSFGGLPYWLDSQGNNWALNAPRGDFLPSDHGMLEWNFDPAAGIVGGTVQQAGKPALARINVRTPMVVSNIWLHVVTGATGQTANQNFVGIYNPAGTLLGSSAAGSLDAKLTTGAVVTQPLSAPVSLGPGFYWVAALFQSSGTSVLLAQGANSVANANTGLTAATYRWAVNGTALTALAGTITPASNALTSGAIPYWAGVS